jgi:YegS/Rv2252/BmrU family lipid kinase
MTRALLITNPFAARAHGTAATTIRDILQTGGWNVEVIAVAGPGDARRIAEQSRTAGFDVVVSHGGDGTAMQIAAGITGTNMTLALVPGGTGNVLAGNLRLPRTGANAARALLRAERRTIDLGVLERSDGPHYFAVVAGTGFDAQLMADTGLQAKRRWKFGAYVARAAMTLSNVRSVTHRVIVDGTPTEVRAAMLLVLNCAKLAPGFLTLRSTIAPDDGWLDIVALDADGVFQTASALVELLLRNESAAGRRVWWARGRHIRVEVPDGVARPVQLDGEVTGATPFEVRLLPSALSVLVGPEFKAHNG